MKSGILRTMTNDNLTMDGLQDLLWNFAGHRVITVASRAGILARLAEQMATPEELADHLGLDPMAAGKMVRALYAMGLLEASGDAYRVTEELAPWFRPGEADMAPFLEHSHMMYESWGENLEHWLRGDPWATKPRAKPDVKKFGAAMSSMAASMAARLAGALNLDGVRTMLDVGGGLGHYARALCEANQELEATVLDTPEVAEMGSAAVAGTELAGRLRFAGGDYLNEGTDYGEGHDLVLQANILHQEVPDRAARLVQRGARALGPGGRLVVLDFAIDEQQRGRVVGALFAINMRSFGDTYTESTLRGWMEQAGLRRIQCQDFTRHRWLITGHRQ